MDRSDWYLNLVPDRAFHFANQLQIQINGTRSFIARTQTNIGPLQKGLGIMCGTDRFFSFFFFWGGGGGGGGGGLT